MNVHTTAHDSDEELWALDGPVVYKESESMASISSIKQNYERGFMRALLLKHAR
jgi:hypothetical protein